MPDYKSEYEKLNLVESTLPISSSLHSTRKLSVGSVFNGQFRVDALLGEGGAGQVYKCTDMTVNRPVALKVLSGHLDERAFRRFQTEASAIGRLDHKSLIRIFEFGLSPNGEPFLVMEFFEGESLSDFLKKNTTLSPEKCIDLFLPLFDALQVMHNSGVVHRDLKPANVLVSDKTGKLVAKIVDFGIAKIISEGADGQPQLTQTGEIFGSPLYMSPEQTRGERISSQTDQYSLGCMIFECLSGTPPHVGKSSIETLIKHQSEPSPTLRQASLGGKYPPGLEHAVAKLLDKDPAKRYASMQEAHNEFETCLSSASMPAGATKSAEHYPIWKSPIIVTISLVIGLLTCLACWYFLFYQGHTNVSNSSSVSPFSPSSTTAPSSTSSASDTVSSTPLLPTQGTHNSSAEEFAELGQKLNPPRHSFLTRTIRREPNSAEQASKSSEQGTILDIVDRETAIKDGNTKFNEFVQRNINARVLSIDPKVTEVKRAKAIVPTFIDDISDTGMEKCKYLKSLEDISIRNSSQITDLGLASLLRLPLRKVLINKVSVGDKTVYQLLHLPSIQVVSIKPMLPQQITDEALKDIPSYAMSVAFLKTDIDDQGLKYLASDSKLQSLTLDDCSRVTSKGLKYIEKLPLSFLSLEGTGISNDAADSISKLDLHHLHLSRTEITDEFLRRLGPMKKLTDLRIIFCHIKRETVYEFRLQHPNCQITMVDSPSGL